MTSPFPISKLYTFGRLKQLEFVASLKRIVPFTVEHALFIGGLAAMAYGAWMVWQPLGPIFGGWSAVKVAMLMSAERR